MPTDRVAIIGGGPAGLMAAEVISQHGLKVDLYDAMPSVGRKFLMAGKSGLNLTHAEPLEPFLSRYGQQRRYLEPIINALTPDRLRDWAHALGIDTFVGSSQRVFPQEMKAAPLLRAWLHRLRASGVRFHMRHRWTGFSGRGGLLFHTPNGEVTVDAMATVLALGGGSWSRLGSTGAWVDILERAGVHVSTLKPSNCGFDVNWSTYLRERHAGEPVKSVALTFTNIYSDADTRQGDLMLTQHGIEGSLVYTFSADVRDMIEQQGSATLCLDLLPAKSLAQISGKLSSPRGKRSLSEHLRRQLGLRGVKVALLNELVARELWQDPVRLAENIKSLPVVCVRARPLDEAISSAGGVDFVELDTALMLKKLPGIFCAGEMLDWDAPTGGYLLTACFASGFVAGHGVVDYCNSV